MGAKSYPWGRSWSQDKSSRAARCTWAFFRENSKWWKNIHTGLTWVSRVKKVIEQFYWLITFFSFNWEQSYLAKLVTLQNCIKMLRNLTFVVKFAYFMIRPNKAFVFWSNFSDKKQLLIVFWATFWEITRKFLENVEQLVESPTRLYSNSSLTAGMGASAEERGSKKQL